MCITVPLPLVCRRRFCCCVSTTSCLALRRWTQPCPAPPWLPPARSPVLAGRESRPAASPHHFTSPHWLALFPPSLICHLEMSLDKSLKIEKPSTSVIHYKFNSWLYWGPPVTFCSDYAWINSTEKKNICKDDLMHFKVFCWSLLLIWDFLWCWLINCIFHTYAVHLRVEGRR